MALRDFGAILEIQPRSGSGGDGVVVSLPPGGPLAFNLTGANHRVFFVDAASFVPGSMGATGYEAQWTVIDAYRLRVEVPPIGTGNPAVAMPPGDYIISVLSGFDGARSKEAFRAKAASTAHVIPFSSTANVSVGGALGGARSLRSLLTLTPSAPGILAGPPIPVASSTMPLRSIPAAVAIAPAVPAPVTPAATGWEHEVRPLIDGEEVFQALHADLTRARRFIYFCFWRLDVDFIIDYQTNTTLTAFCQAALATHPQLEIYFLLWKLAHPLLSKDSFCTPATSPRVHMVKQNNFPAGSHHQKFVLMDLEQEDAALHCMGLNLANKYWDRPHHPYPRYPDAAESRHETGIRIQGPTVAAFEQEFQRRWQAASGAPLPGPRFAAWPRGTSVVAPLINTERPPSPSPCESWYTSSLGRAETFLFIEDQYFDDVNVTTTIVKRYLQLEREGRELLGAIIHPHYRDIEIFLRYATFRNLLYIKMATAKRFWVRGNPNPIVRPIGGWSRITIEDPLGPDHLADGPGDVPTVTDASGNVIEWKNVDRTEGGIGIYRMVVQQWLYPFVYVHSKLAMVDGTYTIGSCNVSRQSFACDSEANVVVAGWNETTELIDRVWTPLVGSAPKPQNLADWFSTFERVAYENRERASHIQMPDGLLYVSPHNNLDF